MSVEMRWVVGVSLIPPKPYVDHLVRIRLHLGTLATIAPTAPHTIRFIPLLAAKPRMVLLAKWISGDNPPLQILPRR